MPKMTFFNLLKYDFLLSSFTGVLESLEHLNEVLPKLYSDYFELEREKVRKNDKVSATEFPKIIEIFKLVKQNDLVNVQTKMSQLSTDALVFVLNMTETYNKKSTTEDFLRQMSIAYLITTFEEFLEKTLKLVFLYKPETLKSENMVKYEEIINLKTYEGIIEHIIEKKSKSIIDKPILELGKTLLDNFGFNLMNDKDWKNFIEVFYRRHVIIHNKAQADDEYRYKTGNKSITDLSPTEDYIKQTILLFKDFSIKISKFFSTKYPESDAIAQKYVPTGKHESK